MKKISKYILASMVVLGAAIAPMVNGVGVGATENSAEPKVETEVNVSFTPGGTIRFDTPETEAINFTKEFTFKDYVEFLENQSQNLTVTADEGSNTFNLYFTDDRFIATGYEISAQITDSTLTNPKLNLKYVTINQNEDKDKIQYEYSPERATEEEVFTINEEPTSVINATRDNERPIYHGAGSWIAKFEVTELLFSSSSLTPEDDKYSATITWTLKDITIEDDTPK